MLASRLSPPYEAVMVALCDEVSVPAVAVKFALDCPAGIVTEDGTVNSPVELLSKIVAALAAA